MTEQYNVVCYDGFYAIEDKFSTHIDGETFKYRCYDKCRAEFLCRMLNEKNNRITDLEQFIIDIYKTVMYMRDNEESNGDEYTSIVLNDLIEEYHLDEITTTWSGRL